MSRMQFNRLRSLRSFLLAIMLFSGWHLAGLGSEAVAQNSPFAPDVDGLQRSYRLDSYQILAKEGVGRGENIFKYKCWVCHHQFQKDAPDLKDLYSRGSFASGDAVSDAGVTAQIEDGGAAMPSFRTTLSDRDVAEVVSYLKSGSCCREEQDPAANPWYVADQHKWPVPHGLKGGAQGVVRTTKGEFLEGVAVQLIAPNNVRTTVYSNDQGRFEFPAMQSGAYTLRIPTPREFKPLRRDGVKISGPAKLEDIVLEYAADPVAETLPATREIESQLSGVELLWNLPGTAKEKEVFRKSCGSVGCHSYQQILKNRYDERSWHVLVQRMIHHGGGPIINADKRGTGLTKDEE